MIYYLNIGLILEQALVDIVKLYLDRINVDDVYANYHISVVNEHPFAHMIVDDHAKCADNFPSIVITSPNDSKSSDLMNVPVQTSAVGLTSKDLDELCKLNKRIKQKINKSGELEIVKRKGEPQIEEIPGIVIGYDKTRIQSLKDFADSNTDKMVYGIKLLSRRKEKISIEIWAENNQLKNELYEHLRILFSNSINLLMNERYDKFDINIFDGSVNGERSNNYNYDFDVVLCGSHISLDVEYNVVQYMLDTGIQIFDPNKIVLEVENHVKTDF